MAALSLAGACAPGLNPVVHLPIPPLHLRGRVVSDSGTPINALVALLRLARERIADTVGRSNVGGDGQFRFEGLTPGTYVLHTRSIGFEQRRDTILLSAPPGLEVVLEMRSSHMCLDLCPPDPRLVEAAHALQSTWQCDREEESIKVARSRWGEFLADSAPRRLFRHQLGAAQISGQLRRVRDDAVCRRLAIALFPKSASLAFTLFRWGPYWLLSDPYFDDGVVVNDKLQQLAGSYGGGFAYWVAERLP